MIVNLQSLKERKLFQWAVAYLAGGWVLLQVLDMVGDKFGWPAVAGRMAIVLVGVGFLAVLVLAWFHGEKGQQSVSAPEVVMLAGILILAGAAMFMVRRAAVSDRDSNATPASHEANVVADRSSIAVLPFLNVSSDPENAYFATGIHDEILTRLANLGGLKVISRTSVMAYKDTKKSMREIGAELRVGTVLEGSVQKYGQKVRVQAQLIAADTDEHLWADTYERDLADIFAIQTDIAQNIATSLQTRLTSTERAGLRKKPTDNAEAYDVFLRAEDYQRRNLAGGENMRSAETLYNRAIAMDPGFALAHARLSYLHGSFYWLRVDPSPARVEKQRAAAERALELSPDLPDSHIAMGYVYYWGMRDYRRALDEFTSALAASPNNAELHGAIALVYRRQGKMRESIAEMEKALALDPRNEHLLQQQGDTYRFVRQFPDAIRTFDRALAISPDDEASRLGKAHALFDWRGDVSEMKKYPQQLSFLLPRLLGDKSAALKDALAFPEVRSGYGEYVPRGLLVGLAKQGLGDAAGARAAFDSARIAAEAAARQAPDDPRMHIAVGYAMAGLGRRDEAIAAGKRAGDLMPPSRDALLAFLFAEERAKIHAQVGDASGAVTLIRPLLSGPSHLSVYDLKINPIWDPIRSDARFAALLRGK